jgi:hypothetical protein
MSYILEAIRKSEWERRRGCVPHLLDQHEAVPIRPPALPRRRWWTGYAVGLGITLFAVSTATISAALWFPGLIPGLPERPVAEASHNRNGAKPTQDENTQLTAVETLPSPPAAPASPAAAAPPMVVVPPGTGWALLPMVAAGSPPLAAAPAWGPPAAGDAEDAFPASELTDGELAALLDSHRAPRAGKPATTKSAAASTTRAEEGSRRGSVPPPREGEPAWYATARAELAAMAATERNGTPPSRQIDAPIAPVITKPFSSGLPSRGNDAASAASIDALPPSVRDALPAISLSVHLYADDPTVRRVRVNNLLVQEGESLGNGLEIAAITRDGVIFRFRGTEFFLAANENWQPQGVAAR